VHLHLSKLNCHLVRRTGIKKPSAFFVKETRRETRRDKWEEPFREGNRLCTAAWRRTLTRARNASGARPRAHRWCTFCSLDRVDYMSDQFLVYHVKPYPVPGTRPTLSRTYLGTVIWPFAVSVVVVAGRLGRIVPLCFIMSAVLDGSVLPPTDLIAEPPPAVESGN
jgi:hypothetical protein